MTQRDVAVYLADIAVACELIESFVAGRTQQDYGRDAQLRSAVERQFEIVGEALNQALKLDPSLCDRIRDARRVVSFRNRLAHGYFAVSNELSWAAVLKVPRLRAQVEANRSELGN